MVLALAILALVGFGALVAFSVSVVTEALYYQGQLAEALQQDLGFTHATPYIRSGWRTADVLVVGALIPGGVFDRVGFRVGDIIHGPSITGLYKMLHRGRGSVVRLTVLQGGDGPPLNQRPRRVIAVPVPPVN